MERHKFSFGQDVDSLAQRGDEDRTTMYKKLSRSHMSLTMIRGAPLVILRNHRVDPADKPGFHAQTP